MPETAAAETRPAHFELIPLAHLIESEFNHRRRSWGDLDELAESIKSKGVLQPILVRPVPGNSHHHEIVFGHRRFRAAKKAGLEEIPATVRELSDVEVLEAQVIENLQRENVHPLEEAEGYEQLLGNKERPYTVDEIAAKVGKSKAYVYARMKLLALGQKARKAFYDGELSPSTALLIARIPRPEIQEKALEEIAPRREDDDPISFRQAAEIIRERFMLRLADAPFDPKDPELLAGTGPCTGCSKRTGAQPELFADVGNADVCTDPSCYQDKVAALWKRKAAEAKVDGRSVIEGKAAKEIFDDYGWHAPTLRYNADFVDLDQACDLDPKRRPYRKLLGKHAAEAVVLARDPKGGIHELLKKGSTKSLLKKAGHEFKRPSYTIPKTPEDRAEAEKLKKKREIEEAVGKRIAARLGQAFDAQEPDREVWDIAIDALLLNMFGDADEVLERRFGAEGAKAFEKARPKMTAEQLRAVFLDMHLSSEIHSIQEKVVNRLIAWAKIDRKKVEAEVKAELATAAKTTSPGKKSKKFPLGAGELELCTECGKPYGEHAGQRCPEASGPASGKCVICGCTDDAGCEEGCAWVDETELVCTAHSEKEIATARKKLADRPAPTSGKLEWSEPAGTGSRFATVSADGAGGTYELFSDPVGLWTAEWRPTKGRMKTLLFKKSEKEVREACEQHHRDRLADELLKNAGAGELVKNDLKGDATKFKKGRR